MPSRYKAGTTRCACMGSCEPPVKAETRSDQWVAANGGYRQTSGCGNSHAQTDLVVSNGVLAVQLLAVQHNDMACTSHWISQPSQSVSLDLRCSSGLSHQPCTPPSTSAAAIA
jgi:hypothetical protein